MASAIVLASGVDHCRAEVDDDEHRTIRQIFELMVDRVTNRDNPINLMLARDVIAFRGLNFAAHKARLPEMDVSGAGSSLKRYR